MQVKIIVKNNILNKLIVENGINVVSYSHYISLNIRKLNIIS